eukprot:7572911-Pyramimonas_sp.AAC.1
MGPDRPTQIIGTCTRRITPRAIGISAEQTWENPYFGTSRNRSDQAALGPVSKRALASGQTPAACIVGASWDAPRALIAEARSTASEPNFRLTCHISKTTKRVHKNSIIN